MKKAIFIIGATITLILAILWYFDIVSEPLVAIGTGVLTLIGYIFVPEKNATNKTDINQEHSGEGDNVGRDKITNGNIFVSENNENNETNLEQKHSGKGDNVARDKITKK